MANFARYWFQMSFEEFGDITPKRFWDLWEQRQNEFKREQFLEGITASMIAAAHGAENISPFDFVGKTEVEAQREEIVLALKKAHQMMSNVAPDMLTKARTSSLTRLKEQNITDADEIVAEVFGD